MNQQSVSQANKVILILVAAIGLYLVSLANYLLFHSLAELFSVMIGTTTFVITWNAREYTKDQFDFLAFISVAYLFVALLDVLHTLSYTGMNVFTDYNFHANQVWVAARFLESLSLLTGFLLLKKRLKINLVLVFLIYSGITLAISLAIFVFHIFPVCYIDGPGQTTFKIVSEFLIVGILLVNMILLNRSRQEFDPTVTWNLNGSLLAAIGSELCFTLYLSNYDGVNLVGHYLKIVSFYFLSRAVVYTSIQKPYATIFRRLMENESALEQASLTDELTGLYNRRVALSFLGKILNQIRHSGGKVTICFIDIDGLKRTNDTLGHLAGDDLLLTVGQLLSHSIREADYACRMGGDEFLLILPQTQLDDALNLLQRIDQRLEHINQSGEKPFPVVFSRGLAYADQARLAADGPEQVMDLILEEADNRMYEDKMAKRLYRLNQA